MNVGEWLTMQGLRLKERIGLLGIDNEEMVEIAPYSYLNRSAYDEGLSKAVPRNLKGEAVPNVPIGNSLTPWREWISDSEVWRAKRSWLNV
jgi:hypothetical protein